VNKKFLLIILVLVGAGLGLYAYLGGFNPVTVQVVTTDTHYLAGRYFAGPLNDEKLGELFRQASGNLDAKKVDGVLANIYYNNPEQENDSIKAFIGIKVLDTIAAIPNGYELKRIAGGKKVVQASVQAHYMLSPKKLYPALFDYLKANKLQTTSTYLEIFLDSRHALVQAELKP
jgi:hypothetical protein